MDYLAANILDSEAGTESEWYNFLWSRTRAIIVVGEVLERDIVACVHPCSFFGGRISFNSSCARQIVLS